MHQDYDNNDHDGLEEEELSKALEELIQLGFAEALIGEDGEFYFRLTKEGYELAEDMHKRKGKKDDEDKREL